jgi:hypothetical protein
MKNIGNNAVPVTTRGHFVPFVRVGWTVLFLNEILTQVDDMVFKVCARAKGKKGHNMLHMECFGLNVKDI